MAQARTEYREEYCCGPKKIKNIPYVFKDCRKTEAEQPVGGKSQAKLEQLRRERAMSGNYSPPACSPYANYVTSIYGPSYKGTHRIQPDWRNPLWSSPTYLKSFNTTLYQPSETYSNSYPQYEVTRTSDPQWTTTRVGNDYEPFDYDGATKNTWQLYRSSTMDPLLDSTSPDPLSFDTSNTTSEVRKTTYVQNSYM